MGRSWEGDDGIGTWLSISPPVQSNVHTSQQRNGRKRLGRFNVEDGGGNRWQSGSPSQASHGSLCNVGPWQKRDMPNTPPPAAALVTTPIADGIVEGTPQP